MENRAFSHYAAILAVVNLEETLAYYVDKLDFKIEFQWGNPPTYAVVERDGLKIHFSQEEGIMSLPLDRIRLTFFVYDPDALYKEFTGRNVMIQTPIGDRVYQMRDFDIRDNNGYILTFGAHLSRLVREN